MESDKENVCNIDCSNSIADGSAVKRSSFGANRSSLPSSDDQPIKPKSHKQSQSPSANPSQSNTKDDYPSSPIIELMVSPPPPMPPRTNNTNDLPETPNQTPIKSPPPPNSENILSAIRQAEQTLNAEIHTVNLLADAGPYGTTGGKIQGNGNGGTLHNSLLLDSSPESDCASSPVPVQFPYMPPIISRSASKKSPMRAAVNHYSPKRTPTRTPMKYSSGGTSSSPLMNKSLLPILTTLEEESGKDEGDEDDEEESVVAFEEVVHGETNDDDDKLEDEEEKIEVDNANDELCDDDESVEILPSKMEKAATSFRRRIIDDDDDSSESESDEEKDDASEQNEGGSEQADDVDGLDLSCLKLNNDTGVTKAEKNVGDVDESVKQKDKKSPPKPYRRRIIDDDEEDDDSSASEESSNSDEDASQASSKSRDEAKPLEDDILEGGFAELNLHDSREDTEERENDVSFENNADTFSAAPSDIDDDDSFLSVTSNKHEEITSDAADEESDDESVTCFDACGCWALDEEHKGDLYLADNSDVMWPKIRLPLALYNKLFPHQRIGVQWMASLHRNEIKGGILADDMGMGKTMQTLTYLGSLMRAQTISNAIVVCPKSVVRSWEREANLILKNMCVPKASVYAITSDMAKEKRKRIFSDAFTCSAKAPRLVVTTYGLVSSHITDLTTISKSFEDTHWGYVVLDEGHLIKNRKTKTSQDVRILSRSKKTHRLLLTGTPIQNNMRELHALFDWATSSQLLGSIQTFLNKYGEPIENGRQRNASDWTVKKAEEMNLKLKKRLQPYFLQRLKKTAFDDKLPEKKELVVFTKLSDKQRRMYKDYIETVFDGEMSSPLAAVTHLKMLCGHPCLIQEASRRYKNCEPELLLKHSSKLQVLLSLIQRLKRSGHRALVFSQSTKMLDIMEKVFDGTVSYLRIDGSTAGKSRQQAVDHFNDGSSGIDIMLLSTKAAGTGLTLTGADRAVIYDPSWNPADDAQAVDRCYRIGQTRNVTVYRFLAAGTVEEKMYEKQVHKDGIKRVVLSGDRSTARYFDQSELADLFKLSPEGECSMLDKFKAKMNNTGAGSSGKPSFLSKHESVIGVASHDVLYSGVAVVVDLTSSNKTSEETPFSRSQFQKAKGTKKTIETVEVEDLTLELGSTHIDEVAKPLGGLNQTRQKRADAKAKQNEEKHATSPNTPGLVEGALSKIDELIKEQKNAEAMKELLDLVETHMDTIKGDEKLALHKQMAHVATLLGWI